MAENSKIPMTEYLKVGGCKDHGTVTIGFHRGEECIAAAQMDLQTALDFMDNITETISEIMIENGVDPTELSDTLLDGREHKEFSNGG